MAGRERCHGCSRIAGALSYRAAAKSVNDVFGIAVQFPVVGFDPARVEDLATYEDPHRYAAGIPYVLVNGRVVIDRGEHTGALPGRVLTPAERTHP